MTTIIIKRDKAGTVSGLCGSRCYNAKSKKCKCVCAGFNHGKGLEKAQYMTDKNRDLIVSNRKPGDRYIIQLQTHLFYG